MAYRYLGGGGDGSLRAWAPPPDPPPTSENFPQDKNDVYQRGPKLEVDFRYTNFLASNPPSPDKGLVPNPPGKGHGRH